LKAQPAMKLTEA